VVQDVAYYPANAQRALLEAVSFTLAPGQAMAVIGPNGAGKTTLLRLLSGLVAPTEGGIWLDGRRLATMTERERRQIGYLPQNVGLIDGTVGENITRFSREGDPIAAARAAGVHDLIGRLPRGYDTELRVDAPALSAGQLQRIGLARALFGQPRLLILDEPDASLDHEGDSALLAALKKARTAGGIVVLITHRTSLLADMDVILELQAGRVVSLAKTRPPPATADAPGVLRLQPP
jgi:ATP-binding cassette subfamily C protein